MLCCCIIVVMSPCCWGSSLFLLSCMAMKLALLDGRRQGTLDVQVISLPGSCGSLHMFCSTQNGCPVPLVKACLCLPASLHEQLPWAQQPQQLCRAEIICVPRNHFLLAAASSETSVFAQSTASVLLIRRVPSEICFCHLHNFVIHCTIGVRTFQQHLDLSSLEEITQICLFS